MNTYTLPRSLDVGGAMETPPVLPIPQRCIEIRREPTQATGTESAQGFVAPTVAPTIAVLGPKLAFSDANQEDETISKKTKKPWLTNSEPGLFN